MLEIFVFASLYALADGEFYSYFFIYLRDDQTFRHQDFLKQMGLVLYSFLEDNGIAEITFTLVVCKRPILLSPSLSPSLRSAGCRCCTVLLLHWGGRNDWSSLCTLPSHCDTKGPSYELWPLTRNHHPLHPSWHPKCW